MFLVENEQEYKKKIDDYYTNLLMNNTSFSSDIIKHCVIPYLGTVDFDKKMKGCSSGWKPLDWDAKFSILCYMTHDYEKIMNDDEMVYAYHKQNQFRGWLNRTCPKNSDVSKNPYRLLIFLHACKCASTKTPIGFFPYHKLFTHNQLIFVSIKKVRKKLKIIYDRFETMRKNGTTITTKSVNEIYEKFFRHLYKSGMLKRIGRC